MMNSDAIHHSVAEADDLEEIHDAEISVGDVLRSLVQHPAQIITRWNWKSALIGAVLRASIYFTIYKASRESWLVTLTAVFVEFCFRFFTSGISGALVQSFRRATPAWLATIIVMISLPVFSHTVEFITHYTQENFFRSIFAASENNARQKTFAVSVMFSIMSALFNLFIMRHGVLLVGAGSETKSFFSDMKKIPFLIIEFLFFLPNEILSAVRSGKLLLAFGIFASFGLSIGSFFGIFRGKWSWAWTTAAGAWCALFVFVLIVAATKKFFNFPKN